MEVESLFGGEILVLKSLSGCDITLSLNNGCLSGVEVSEVRSFVLSEGTVSLR